MPDSQDDNPQITIMQPDRDKFRRSEGLEDLFWSAQASLKQDISGHGRMLAEQGGQLKTIPALAAAIQQNFGIWFAAIAVVAAAIFAGFAFLGSYQVSNNQLLNEHSAELTAQSGSIGRIEEDVRSTGQTLDKLSVDVARLADREEQP